MKKITLIILLFMFYLQAGAQFGNILDKATKKAEDKLKSKAERKADDTVEGKKTGDNKSEDNTGSSSGSENVPSKSSAVKVYSKFDFVPGEKIMAFEDFMQDAIGDFPDKWNTNASGEIVTLEGKAGRWFMLTKAGVFMPEFIDSLPENFTLEYDLLCDNPPKSWSLYTSVVSLNDRSHPEYWQSVDDRFTFTVAPGSDGNGSSVLERRKAGVAEPGASSGISQFANQDKPVHVAIWRQKERMRIYLNEEKTWDIPKAVSKEAKFNSIVFWFQATDGSSHFLMTNLRLAVGAPDMRNKLITEGKLVTHGILFDVNSSNIKPESYGTLKEIANVLKENSTVSVKIIGHTDADGDDKSNLDLSKRRAQSVKEFLTKEFSIEDNRMETEGMGESKPVDKNTTPAGKANNRRVEFVKIQP